MPDALAYQPVLPRAPILTPRGVTLAPAPTGHILHAMARRGAAIPAQRLTALGDGSPHALRPLGPGQWLIVGDAALTSAEVAAKTADLADVVTLFDSSEGRVRLSAAGAGAFDLLASGSGLDVRPSQFALGATAATLWRHLAVVVTRTDRAAFEIIVARSFAQSLWEELAA